MNSVITVISVGTGDPELLNLKTLEIIQNAKKIVLRTDRHPIAQWLKDKKICYTSMDLFYETCEDFDQLNTLIAEELWRQAEKTGLVYGVMDLATDQTVRRLFALKPALATIRIIPGISFYDTALAESVSALSDSNLRIVSAYDLVSDDYNPNQSVLITEIDQEILAGQVKLYLGRYINSETKILFFQDRKESRWLPLYELDRQSDYNHCSMAFIPSSHFLSRDHFVLQDLLKIMDTLRSPEGCSWDYAQTHQSLRSYMIEEAWECVSCIDENNMDHLSEELGDLLFQIVFHSSIGKAFDEFSIEDVIDSICSKMIRRHPHVFKNQSSDYISELPDWEKIKQTETGHNTLIKSLDDIAVSLPSLTYAEKTIKKIRNNPNWQKSKEQIIREMSQSLNIISSVSDAKVEMVIKKILWNCAELCFAEHMDGELLLHTTTKNLKDCLKAIEEQMEACENHIESLTFAELGVYLNHVEGEIE